MTKRELLELLSETDDEEPVDFIYYEPTAQMGEKRTMLTVQNATSSAGGRMTLVWLKKNYSYFPTGSSV